MNVKNTNCYVSELISSNYNYYKTISEIRKSNAPDCLKDIKTERAKQAWLNGIIATIGKYNRAGSLDEQKLVGILDDGSLGCLLELPDTFNTEHVAVVKRKNNFELYYRGIIQSEYMEDEPYTWVQSDDANFSETITALFDEPYEKTTGLQIKLEQIFLPDEPEYDDANINNVKTYQLR